MSAQPASELPLAGITVVELHAIGPVPFAGQLLRRLGARVMRVSPPNDPGLGVSINRKFDALNQGKEALALDLKSDADLARLHEVLASADVLLEGFRPGVLERLRLAPDELAQRHPRLVVGRLSGWGTRGPWAARAGHDINYLAIAGILDAIGPAERPVPPLNLVADFGGGAMHLLVGVLARLVRRSATGQGGLVQTSILAGSVGLTGMFYGLMANGVWDLVREANLLDGGAPYYRCYRCADGRHVAVGAIEPKFYADLLRITDLAGEIKAADQNRRETWPATVASFERRFAERTRDEWAAVALTADACLTPVLDFAEAARDEQNMANALFEDDGFRQPGLVIEFQDRARS